MIGETAIINTLGELEVLDAPQENGVPLSEFADLVDEKFGEKSRARTAKNFFSYEMEPRGKWSARGRDRGYYLPNDIVKSIPKRRARHL